MQMTDESDNCLAQALSMLDQWNLIDKADEIQPLGNAAVCKTSVLVYLMLYQRMSGNRSLKEAVEYFFNNAPITPNSNRRIRERSLDLESGSYSAASKRLSVDLVNWLQTQVFDSIIRTTTPSFKSRRVFLIDGTILSAAPTPSLKKAFPPSTNQRGVKVLPMIQLVTAHELSSGAALPPEIGPQNGPNAIGETLLAEGLIARLPPESTVMADSAFGIFHVAFKAREHGHNFVFRLTSARFESHLKQAELVGESEEFRTYRLTWRPSKKECASHPLLPKDASLEVRIIATKIGEEWHYLITDINAMNGELKSLYIERHDIEVDIRNIKMVLKAEHFYCMSLEMLHKEIGVAMVAYNLTTQLRRLAAAKAKRSPQELSFTGVWVVYRHQLQNVRFTNAKDLQQALSNAIDRASKNKLPNRPGRRSSQ